MQHQLISSSFAVTQMRINKIPLPMDNINMIKDFIFYDYVTGRARVQKAQVCKTINCAPFSRNSLNMQDDDGIWVFREEYNVVGFIGVQFQAMNCVICGNYRSSDLIFDGVLPERIRCRCPDNHEFDDF
jgi:hypothetical protein